MNSSHGYTVFLDDSKTLLKQYQHGLTQVGFTHGVYVNTRKQAEKLIVEMPVSRVISDWKMAGNGSIFLQDIAVSHPEIQCVLLTGYTRDLDEEEAVALKSLGITVFNKNDISGSTVLLNLATGGEVECAQPPVQKHAPWSKGDQAMSETDEIVAQRLVIESLTDTLDTHRKLAKHLAEGLVKDLKDIEIEESSDVPSVFSSRQRIDDMIDDLLNLTPRGLKLLELDRRMMARNLRQSRKDV